MRWRDVRAARPKEGKSRDGQRRERLLGAHAKSSAGVGCWETIGEGEMETLRASPGAESRCWDGDWLRERGFGSLVEVGVRDTFG